MKYDIRLFKLLYDCYIHDEDGNEIKVKGNENYWFKFGNFNNGGWPMIYIPEKNKWYDFCMYDDGTAEWDENVEQIAEEVQETTNSDAINRKETTNFLRNHAKSFNDAKVRIIFESAASLIENPDNIPPVTDAQESKQTEPAKSNWLEVNVEKGAYEGEKVIINVDQLTHIAPNRQIHLSDGMVISADIESMNKLLDILGMP